MIKHQILIFTELKQGVDKDLKKTSQEEERKKEGKSNLQNSPQMRRIKNILLKCLEKMIFSPDLGKQVITIVLLIDLY